VEDVEIQNLWLNKPLGMKNKAPHKIPISEKNSLNVAYLSAIYKRVAASAPDSSTSPGTGRDTITVIKVNRIFGSRRG
jgi:hypothetical protein